ncbi:MAG: DNA polymerase I [Planctomycetia bacterium]|nr:DNA polymerase I [Planctomycetia bacterium]
MSVQLQGKTVCVLDTYGILYQVFHTMREMSSPQGEPTGAVFGFVRDLLALLTVHRPDYMFCAFDRHAPTFRHEIYAAYKANRQEMPDDLRPQIAFTRDFINGFGIAEIGLEGFEADDLLATVARITEEAQGKCLLITADKDARQLITDHVSLFNLRKQIVYTKKELMDDWGIAPEQVIDFQTMVGDAADNVPGIPLIGPKTATQLLKSYGTLENIYDHLDELSGKKKENIESFRTQADLSASLVRLKNDVPIELDWEKARFQGIDPVYLGELCRYFGFKSFLPKIDELVQTFGSVQIPHEKRIATADLLNSSISNGSSPEKSVSGSSLSDMGSSGDSAAGGLTSGSGWSAPDLHRDELLNALLEAECDPDVLALRKGTLIEEDYNRLFVEKGFQGSLPVSIVYRLVDTEEKWNDFYALLSEQKIFSIDLETTDVRPRFAQIVGIAICFDIHEAWYLPLRGPLGSNLLDSSMVLDKLRPILESKSIRKLGQNIKYDMIVFRGAGIRLQGIAFDTMVADYLLNAGDRTHNLDDLADRYFGHKTIKITELIGAGKKQKRMDDIPAESVAEYAGEDALIAWALFPVLYSRLKEDPDLLRLYLLLEIPLIDVLVEMEFAGIAIRPDHFRDLSQKFQKRLDLLQDQILSAVAEADSDEQFARNFNINSPLQLQRVLFDDLHLPVLKKTKTGRSTDIEVLEELAAIHPLPKMMIEHRQLVKLKGTYLDPLPLLRHPETGRIHSSFNQVVTATGRLSSSDPNLQNIPVRTEEGKEIRRGFVPDEKLGFDTLISCDYSQIELRVLSHFSGDDHLRKAFAEDLDIHTDVASHLFDIPAGMVSSEMRRTAKAVNFGLIYGQSAFGLSKMLGISREEAASYIDSFFKTYPGIPIFLDQVLDDCLRKGYVETLFGRKRRIEGVRSVRKGQQLNMPERTAINTVIQGSAADLMKLAMVKVWQRLYRIEKIAPEKTNMLLQIHDELVLETKAEDRDEISRLVVQDMELGQPLSVPLKIDVECGSAWGKE